MKQVLMNKIQLKEGTNAFQLEYNGNEEISIRRYVDRKWYKEGEDFQVLNNGHFTKIILFNKLLDRSSEYEIYRQTTDRM